MTRVRPSLVPCVIILASAPGCGNDAVGPGLDLTVAIAAARDTVLAGDTVTLVADVRRRNGSTAPGANVTWLRSPGIPIGNGTTVTPVLPDSGLITIVANAQLEGVRGTATTLIDVVANSPPVITEASRSTPVAYDVDTVLLTATATDIESPVRITWTSSVDGILGTGDSVRWVPGPGTQGMHLITARATDAQGQRAEQLLQVEVLSTARFRWTLEAGSDMLASADDGTVYASLSWFSIGAIRPGGEVLWERSLPAQFWDHSSGLTLAPDGTAFVFVFHGTALALAPDGTKLWERTAVLGRDPHGRFALAPDGGLYAGGQHLGGNVTLRRLDPATGDILWSVERPGSYGGGPAVRPDGRVAFQFAFHTSGSSGAVQLLVEPTGVVLREDTLDARHRSHYMGAMGSDGDTYYPNGNAGLLTAIGPDGSFQWEREWEARIGEPVVAADGTVYVVAGGHARALAPDGTVLWQTALEGYSWIPRLALLADGSIWISLEPFVYRLDAATGALVETIRLKGEFGGSPLAVADDGTLYVVNGDRLIAIQGPAGLDASAPWPVWRRDNRRTASVPR